MSALAVKIVISFCRFSLGVCWEAEPTIISERTENVGSQTGKQKEGEKEVREIKSDYYKHINAEKIWNVVAKMHHSLPMCNNKYS